ncbi:MAG: flavodoxin family protein [Desulfovibrio sp.]|nr:flavodoxin family protein [Desulfovibrio sp.]
MPKNIVIISSSPRKNSNSHSLAEAFAEGARQAGHSVELVSLRGKAIGFCRGCMACQKTRRCVQRDDADAIAQLLLHADVVCFATPIYYYAVSGQLKTMLDRCNPLYPADYAFREVYLLASSTDTSPSAMDGAVKDIEGWVECFPQARLAGVVRGTGVTAEGDILGHPGVLEESRKLGRQC